MNRFNIILIGAGQLGSRHLQGLAQSDLPVKIYISEPDARNLATAIDRFNEVSRNKVIELAIPVRSTDDLPEIQFDLAVFATNADVRAKLTETLVNKHKVRNIIFEKVAFQSEEQFEEIIELLKNKGVKSWVNCPRRFFTFYQNLRNELKVKGPLHLHLEGTDWGLACNSVHFIDLLAFLSGEPVFEPSKPELEPQIFESKRQGFIEFYGTIYGQSSPGHAFTFTCLKKKDDAGILQQKMQLSYISGFILIREGVGIAEFFKNGESVPFKTEPVKMLYQSGLTNIQAKEIIVTGKSSLPSLEESYEIHKPLLKILKDHYKKVTGVEIVNLPIT